MHTNTLGNNRFITSFFEGIHSIRLNIHILQLRVTLSFLVTALMLLLPCWLLLHNITFSTHFEESVGFRYFHSLRLLYGHEYPWLPQGQLPGILHIAIQYFLTLIGHPVDQFFPRVDYFSNLAIVIPFIFTGIVYFWATKPIHSVYIQLLFAMLFVASFYSPRYQDGWMLLPDYHIWMISLSFLAIGWCARIMPTNNLFTGFTNKSALLLGVYAGLCLGVKFTLFTYPMTLGLLFIVLDRRMATIIRLSCISIPISMITWVVILAIYYQGNFSILPGHFKALFAFTDSQVQIVRDDNIAFIKTFWPLTLLDIFPLIPLMIFGSVLAFKKNGIKTYAGILLPVCLLEVYMLYQRNYTHTNVEIQYLFLIVGTIMTIHVYQHYYPVRKICNWLLYGTNEHKAIRYSLLVVSLVVPILIHVSYTLTRLNEFTDWLKELNIAGKGMHNSLSKNSGGSLFLIPISASVDEYNLRTIDNGLFKAGSGLSPEWNPNTFVAKLYKNRSYASNSRNIPTLDQFENIIFRTNAGESIPDAIERLEHHYRSNFTKFNCNAPEFSYQIPTKQTLVFCTKNQKKLF